MLPMMTEPSLVEVRLSGKIFSPGMLMMSGGVAAAAANEPAATGSMLRDASKRCRTDSVMFEILIVGFLESGLRSVRVGNTVDRVIAVLAHQERAVAGDHGSD